MDHTAIGAIFKPKPSQQETKADTTTKIARGIIDAETVKREAKTERLRLARLAKEASEADAEPVAKPVKKKTSKA